VSLALINCQRRRWHCPVSAAGVGTRHTAAPSRSQ